MSQGLSYPLADSSLLVLHHLVSDGLPHLDKKGDSRLKIPGLLLHSSPTSSTVSCSRCTLFVETYPGCLLVGGTRYSLYSHEPVNKRLKSRNSFVHSVTPLNENPPAERLRVWAHHLRSVPQKLTSIPSEDLGLESEAPWLHYKCLNRLRTGVGRYKSNMENRNTVMLIVGSRGRLWSIC